jgi:hypothetical protein
MPIGPPPHAATAKLVICCDMQCQKLREERPAGNSFDSASIDFRMCAFLRFVRVKQTSMKQLTDVQ